jgi:hypothetical protein
MGRFDIAVAGSFDNRFALDLAGDFAADLAGIATGSALAAVARVRRGRVVVLVFFLSGASINFPFIAAIACFGITSPFAKETLRRSDGQCNAFFPGLGKIL